MAALAVGKGQGTAPRANVARLAAADRIAVSRYALIGWHADGTPFSRHFGDVYYSRESGLEESRHVFLSGNGLPARFAAAKGVFRVGELGFGTGLNFLAAWEAFLRPDAFSQALAPWKALAPLPAMLSAVYHPHVLSRHVFTMLDQQIILTLHYHSALKALESFPAGFDAWFLDGFAPGKNEEMWENKLLSRLFLKTKPAGTAATFTVARAVRDGLANAGFLIEKKPGFGRKREMLTARRPFG
jgi:tRNA 5-methylaminomethyl-2-thiouridine biosynthesis bifunctional protein